MVYIDFTPVKYIKNLQPDPHFHQQRANEMRPGHYKMCPHPLHAPPMVVSEKASGNQGLEGLSWDLYLWWVIMTPSPWCQKRPYGDLSTLVVISNRVTPVEVTWTAVMRSPFPSILGVTGGYSEEPGLPPHLQ